MHNAKVYKSARPEDFITLHNEDLETVKFPSGSLIIDYEGSRGRFILPEKQKSKMGDEIQEESEPKTEIDHILVPRHEIISGEEAKSLIEQLKIKHEQLPRIFAGDPAIAHLGPKVGNLIRITRNSATAGTAAYYRLVVESEGFQGEE